MKETVDKSERLEVPGIDVPAYMDPSVATMSGEGRTVLVESYGCQMNVADTEIVYSVMRSAGYQVAKDAESADVVFLNTCAIRENAEEKIWARLSDLRKAKRTRKDLVIGVLGCMAERLKTKVLETNRSVDLVVGPDAYRSLPSLLAKVDNNEKAINVMLSADETYADIAPVRTGSNGVSAYVSIMRGCNNMCSYCIVPFTRGRERSRSVASIVAEVEQLSRDGYKEVTLLGQNVNSYNYIDEQADASTQVLQPRAGFNTVYRAPKRGTTFTDLMDAVSRVDPEMRIRFTSPHPKDFPDSIHMPAQSGNSAVLERMRRGYTRESYLELVAQIRRELPRASISSDFISGFCGETEQEHEDTISLIKECGFEKAYMFMYSLREKTHAHRTLSDDVPVEVKSKRLREVIDTFYAGAKAKARQEVGRRHLVLIDGVSKRSTEHFAGRTDCNKTVIIPNIPIPSAIDSNDTSHTIRVGDYIIAEIIDQSLELRYESPDKMKWNKIHRVLAVGVFLLTWFAFSANQGITIGEDSNSNMLLAMRLATTKNSWSLAVRAVDHPCLFTWNYRDDPSPHAPPRVGLSLAHWNVTTKTRLASGETVTKSAWQLYEMGRMTLDGPKYSLVRTTEPGLFANTFGVGTAITAAPIFWAYAKLHRAKDVMDVCAFDRNILGDAAKLAASVFSAVSATAMFFVFLRLSPVGATLKSTTLNALIMTLLYAMGTTMLSVNSQALWQHAPNTMFLSLGILFLLKADEPGTSRRHAALASVALSAATFCRPTSAVYPIAVGVYLAVRVIIPGLATRSQRLATATIYALVGAIFGALFLYHNHQYFGSPFATGQMIAASGIALTKGVDTGTWSTPFLTGALALFLSPSRGLFVHSPFLMYAPRGLSNLRSHPAIAPFLLAAFVLTYAASTFFDYWGGWAFGTRPLTDTSPIFSSLVALALPNILDNSFLSMTFIVASIWSISVHIIGNVAYDPMIWNYQKATPSNTANQPFQPITDYKIITNQAAPPPDMVHLNIDDISIRHDRLWQWSSSQIVFLYQHFSLSRAVKQHTIDSWKAGRL
eukprot:gene7288-8470_t